MHSTAAEDASRSADEQPYNWREIWFHAHDRNAHECQPQASALAPKIDRAKNSLSKLIIYTTVLRFSVSPKLLVATILCSAAFVLCAGMARAQQGDPLLGKWKMISTTPDGSEVLWSLTITYANGKYAATSASDQGEGPVKD